MKFIFCITSETITSLQPPSTQEVTSTNAQTGQRAVGLPWPYSLMDLPGMPKRVSMNDVICDEQGRTIRQLAEEQRRQKRNRECHVKLINILM